MEINGVKVFDADKKLVLEITPDDVAKGNNKDPGACAAAKACLRQIPGVVAARVHIARTYLKVKDKKTKKETWVRFRTPLALRSEIIAFDRGGEFSAGEFTLEKIQPVAALGKKRKQYKPTGKQPQKGKRTKRAYHRVNNVRAHGANK